MRITQITFLLILFSSYYSYGQITVENLKVDTSITGFHFAADFRGTYVYTANGKSDLNTLNPSAFSFSVMPNATYKDAKNEITQLLKMSTSNGYTHSDIIQKDTIVNGYKVYFTSLTETGYDYKNLLFHAFYIKENTAVVFVSGDLENGKYREKFKETFYKTRL